MEKSFNYARGTKLELVCDYDPIEWAKYLNRFGSVAVVYLDAAMGVGSNHELIKSIKILEWVVKTSWFINRAVSGLFLFIFLILANVVKVLNYYVTIDKNGFLY